MKKIFSRTAFTVAGLMIVLLVLLIAALKCGTIPVSWQDLTKIFSSDGTGTFLRELRLARSLAAIISGASAAFAGVILQKVLRNNLAAPDILGISSGAGLTGCALLLIFPQWSNYLNIAAFAGALTAAAFICIAAWKRGLSPGRLILCGVAISALFAALTGGLILFHADKIFPVMEFTIGGFSGKSWENVTDVFPFVLILILLAPFLPRKLDLLSLGELEAASLGASVKRDRALALITAALAASLSVSLAGLLGFVGLMAPHIARKLTNSSRGKTLLITAPLTGAVLTLTGDLAGKMLFAPREIPAGLPLSLAGALFFLMISLGHREEL